MGWAYKDWEGVFYPPGTSRKDHLSYYAEQFPTVEANSTFYGELKTSTAMSWHKNTPEGFVFSVKAPAFITHQARLRVSDKSRMVLSAFLKGSNSVREKLGPILFQLPATLEYPGQDAFKSFLALLPEGGRHAFEFRHPSWFKEEAFKVMETHKASIALSTSPSGPFPLVLTSDFLYLRIRGDMKWSKREEGEEEIASFASWLRGFLKSSPMDIYVYWDNIPMTLAPYSALLALKLLQDLA